MAKLTEVRKGLLLAWDLGFKFLQIEIDSSTVLSRLTNRHALYPPDMLQEPHEAGMGGASVSYIT